MKYGEELVKALEDEIRNLEETSARRWERINEGLTGIDDCFVSMKCEERGIANNKQKIKLIRDGGCAWFTEYATLDGKLVNAHWCNTKFGSSLRAEMPDGSVVWSTARTAKGLAKKGLKIVECKRPAWYKFTAGCGGMLGVFSGDYELFPSRVNYATGEEASNEPLEIREV